MEYPGTGPGLLFSRLRPSLHALRQPATRRRSIARISQARTMDIPQAFAFIGAGLATGVAAIGSGIGG